MVYIFVNQQFIDRYNSLLKFVKALRGYVDQLNYRNTELEDLYFNTCFSDLEKAKKPVNRNRESMGFLLLLPVPTQFSIKS